MNRALPSVADLAEGVRLSDRASVGRAITLVESALPAHRALAGELLTALIPLTGHAARVGITGVPGVGKSTLIEALGMQLIAAGKRPAVLAIDPSSPITGGSILGDKTRMGQLSVDPRAFVRPSPTGGTLGGAHARTREAILVCEAAGYDPIVVETVGVGQSEVAVADMVDAFVVLLLPNAGDDLQGIKKGILEVADILAINKADIDPAAARRARRDLDAALRLLRGARAAGSTVLELSGATGLGLPALWDAVEGHLTAQRASGAFEARRTSGLLHWTRSLIEGEVMTRFFAAASVAAHWPDLEAQVRDGTLSPVQAAAELLLASPLGAR